MGKNLFVYPNRQTVVRQMFPINTDVFSLSDKKFVYMSLSPFGDEILETGPLFHSKVESTIRCHIDDSMSLKQIANNIDFALAPIFDDLDSVNICITAMMQYGHEQERFMDAAYSSILHSDIPLEFLFKTLSPRVQVCDYFFVQRLLSLLVIHSRTHQTKVNFFVDDPTEAEYPQYTSHFGSRFYYHHIGSKNPLFGKLKYFPYPFYHLMKDIDEDKICHDNRYIGFSVGLTDYSKRDTSRKEMITSLMNGLEDSELGGQFSIIRYFSLDKGLMNWHDEKHELLTYQEYRNEMSHSKFTLVIPSYHEGAWSNKRFWEAVSVGCLPLVYDPINRRQEGLDFDESAIEIVDKYLLLTCEPKDICEHIVRKMEELKDNRIDIIKTLLNTTVAKYLRNEESYKNGLATIFS